MQKIDHGEHAELLYRLNQLPADKGHRIAADLQMYLHKYQELLQGLEETIRNYKETARKIKGGE